MKRGIGIFLILSLMFVIASFAVSADEIIINSRDWKDVYSGIQYGYLIGKQPHFLTAEKHGEVILYDIKDTSHIEILTSSRNSFISGYKSFLESKGYEASEIISASLSIELAKRMDNINKYIILDDSYGYNAIAVAPYAILSKSFVLFADKDNIGEVSRFLSRRNVESVMIYGAVNREVLQQLDKYKPEIINNEADRYLNNIEIVKRFKELKDARQIILSNGEFIEAEIMSGSQPVLFIGSQNVPDSIQDYIKNSDIEVGVLIGNDLLDTATAVRRLTGISTFVKFARSARTPSDEVAKVEDLDLFKVPKVNIDLELKSIRYNPATRQILVTIQNNADVVSYFSGTYTITSGDFSQTLGDDQPVFIDAKDTKTIAHNIDPIPGEEDIMAKVYVIYGESKYSLEFALEGDIQLERVDFDDESSISIESLAYDKPRSEFKVRIKNIGEVDTYVDAELVDLLIMDTKQTLGSENTIFLKPGETSSSIIKADLSDEDLTNNNLVKVRAYYGEDEDILAKVVEKDMDISILGFDIIRYIPIMLIIILVILVILVIMKKRKRY